MAASAHKQHFKEGVFLGRLTEIKIPISISFIDRLKEAKDVDGSRLFDNCIVSYGTNLRSGHELKNVPAILTGGGAKDIKHGRHIVLPQEDTPLANYWLTLMQQAGVPIEQFSHSTGVIPELCS